MRPKSDAVGKLEPQPSAINWSELDRNKGSICSSFAVADPWQHVVIDDFLEPTVALEAARFFPTSDRGQFLASFLFGTRTYDGDIDRLGEPFTSIFQELYGRRFTSYIEQITGIIPLEADTSSFGAGIHQGGRGSVLRLHADHNMHPLHIGYRRVNVMLYLNENWRPRWNGALRLWDREATTCVKSIEPLLNRCVIMAVDDSAYHSYGPLRTPWRRTRNALAAYYYAAVPADRQSKNSHITIWPGRKGENRFVPFIYRFRRFAFRQVTKLKFPRRR